MFYNGTNCDIEYAKAAVFLRRAQDAESLFLLGEIYRQGKSVEPDLALSFDYYNQSAEKDHRDAMFWVGQFTLTETLWNVISYRRANGS